MAKYDPLAVYLERLPATQREVTMTFAHVAEIVGGLPATAYNDEIRQWWGNDSKVQAKAWRSAGWHVDGVDYSSESVRFARGKVGGTRTRPS